MTRRASGPRIQAICAACGRPIRSATWEALYSPGAAHPCCEACWRRYASGGAVEALWTHCESRAVQQTDEPTQEAV